MGIRDKAKEAKAKAGSNPPTASAKPKAEPKPAEPKATVTKLEPKAAEPKAETPAPKPADVTDIRDKMIDNLSDDDVEKLLASQASGPLVAGLAATRETKLNQVQYDGKTSDGYVVRVWAPDGAEMLVKARLEVVA